MKPFLEAIDERVLVCDGAMGTMLYAKGIFINRCFDALNLTEPTASPRCTRTTCAPAPMSSRRTPSAPTASSCAASAWPTGCATSTSRAPGSPRRARRRAGVRGRRDRPARHPHRAVGQDRAGRGRGLLPRAGAGAARRRRRPVRPRDVSRPERGPRGDCGDSQRLRPADRRADDDRGRRQQPRRHAARAVCRRRSSRYADVIGVNCSIGPAPMLETVERMSAITQGASRRAAQRRPPARHRGAQYLSVVAGIHRVVRAALHEPWRAAGRRLLRHDAGAHPPDQDGGEEVRAGGGTVPRRTRPRGRQPRRAAVRGDGRSRSSPPVPRARAVAARARAGGGTLRDDRPADAAEGLRQRGDRSSGRGC